MLNTSESLHVPSGLVSCMFTIDCPVNLPDFGLIVDNVMASNKLVSRQVNIGSVFKEFSKVVGKVYSHSHISEVCCHVHSFISARPKR
jgi:hypothetical protein